MIKTLHRWTRLSSVKWEDAWTERLAFLNPEHLAFLTWPDSRALKIEAYCDQRTASLLVKRFGGRATKIAPHIWTGDPARPRAPLAIRNKLKIFSDKPTWTAWQKNRLKPPGILIPAGMAFGTGEHATTVTCLRFLADLLPNLPEKFAALDLGTGSGILAIAALALGADRAEALDFDPHAVRIATQNARTNGFRALQPKKTDVLKDRLPTRFDVALANLYSDILIAAAPRIARTLKPGGSLIFSGVLCKQADEVASALQNVGFSQPKIIRRGKWCAGRCVKKVTKRPSCSDGLVNSDKS